MAFETEPEEDDAEPAAEDVPAEGTGVTDRSDELLTDQGTAATERVPAGDAEEADELEEDGVGSFLSEAEAEGYDAGTDEARSPSRRRPATSTSPARSRNRGSPS